MATRTFKEKRNKHNKKRHKNLVERLNFYIYIDLDDRERARARDTKQKRPISFEEKHENFIAAERKREMLAATKVKMSGSEKKVSEAHLVHTYKTRR